MFIFAVLELFKAASAGSPPSCSNPALSCHNTTIQSNTCCFNSPGGQLLQTQFWDTNPTTGPWNSWTIHGLWPDNCDGTYESSCDSSREYTGISSILTKFGYTSTLNYMNTYWKDIDDNDETFWEHEWSKHGTCISTLEPSCYTNYQSEEECADFFKTAVNLFQTLPSYNWLAQAGIVPSQTTKYSAGQIQNALSAQHGFSVTIQCTNGALDEIWYSFDVLGSVQTGQFVPASPVGQSSNCPSTGIQYLPKSGTPSSTSSVAHSSTSTMSSASATSSGGSLSGKGYLNVINSGSQDGCLISAGTWYVSGTCATYTAAPSGSGFTLTSSKGKCAISNGEFTCSSSVSTATVFTTLSGYIAYSGQPNFYVTAVAQGQTQQTVYTTSHSVTIQIKWQAQ